MRTKAENRKHNRHIRRVRPEKHPVFAPLITPRSLQDRNKYTVKGAGEHGRERVK